MAKKFNIFKDTNNSAYLDTSKVSNGTILIPDKISPMSYHPVINASDIDWRGFHIESKNFTYTGDVLAYIKSELDKKASVSTQNAWDSMKMENVRNIFHTADNEDKVDAPEVSESGQSSLPEGWAFDADDLEEKPFIWMSSIIEKKSINGPDQTIYCGPCAKPVVVHRYTGINGNFKSTVFCRTNTRPDKPSDGANYSTGLPSESYAYVFSNQPEPHIHTDENRITINGTPIEWYDGIPEGQEKLWATTALIKDEAPEIAKWSVPSQMTDTDTYDVEFAFEQANDRKPAEPNDGNRHKDNSPYNGQIWFDPTLDESLPNGKSWSNMYWRAERRCINGVWSTWTIIRIKGERGSNPDYFEQRWGLFPSSSNEIPPKPLANSLTLKESDETWKLTPVYALNKNTWMTARKVRTWIENGESKEQYEDGSEWSTPIKINGLTAGTVPQRQVLKYTWHTSYTEAPACETGVAEPGSNWKESPANASGNNAYLWMIQGEQLDGQYKQWDTDGDPTTDPAYWSEPICLSGKDGEPGKDGDGIEFIYLRTSEKNVANIHSPSDASNNRFGDFNIDDWPFVQNYRTTESGIKFVYETTDSEFVEGDNTTAFNNNEDDSNVHNVWTDNPLGVTSKYKYEYAAIRKKVNNAWVAFCSPFLWSKYGEDGIDGDGVEYIFYLSKDKDESTEIFAIAGQGNSSYVNPANWDIKWNMTQTEYAYINGDNKSIYINESEYLGPSGIDDLWNDSTNGIGWTDDPRGVDADHKYEYVSIRHKRTPKETGEITPKSAWGPFSKPAIWARYAEDGVATSLVLDSDNDNISIGIDADGIVNKNYTDEVNFTLRHNTNELTLGDDYTLSIDLPDDDYVSVSNSKNKITVTIHDNRTLEPYYCTFTLIGKKLTFVANAGFDMSDRGNIISLPIVATITDNYADNHPDIEQGTKVRFALKVSGIGVSDIYKIMTDKIVAKRIPTNDGYEPIRIYLKSLSSNNVINNNTGAENAHMYIKYVYNDLNETGNGGSDVLFWNIYNDTICNANDIRIPVGVEFNLNPYYNSHKFTLYYNSGTVDHTVWTADFNTSNGFQFLDEETVSAVYDGSAGTDSKSQEYIYFLCDDSDKTFSSNEDPTSTLWRNNSEYQEDDFPFVDGVTEYYGWTDHPQGIDDKHRYEYISTRSYITSGDNKGWSQFTEPVIWANWGHTGEDGDGVEYIYYLCDDEKTFSGDELPLSWFGDTDYQNSEYIRSDTGWTDNPTGVSNENKYEYVSIRKYKNLELNDNDNASANYKNKFPINYNNKNNNPSLLKPYIDISYINDYSIKAVLGSNTANGKFNENRIDITYAVFYFISMLWKYVYELDKDKPWGNNYYYYPTNAYQMFVYLIVYSSYLCNNEIFPQTFRTQFIDNNLAEKIKQNIPILKDKLETIFNNFLNNGFLILDHDSNAGKNVQIFNKDTTFTEGDVSFTIKSFNRKTKEWQFFSYPKLWAKYGEQGPPGVGEPGKPGPQGFTGPIVRMRGEYNSSKYYSDGSYRIGQSTAANNYSETDGPIYVDIVIYKNKYWKCNSHKEWSTGTGNYVDVTKNTGYCYNNGFNSDGTSTTNSSDNNEPYWVEATQFDFVATKLLYADQALINQLSTHDVIATNSDGYPVAGITSGAEAMKDKDNLSINPYLNNYGSSHTSNNNNNDPIRIFAGQIEKGSIYDLNNAPFRVTEKGVAYMENAVVKGNITADEMYLGEGSFKILTGNNGNVSPNTIYELPKLQSGKTRNFYILSQTPNMTIRAASDDTLTASVNVTLTSGKIKTENNTFYQCISVNNTWNVIATKIQSGSAENRYYELDRLDVTSNVILFGYVYDNDNSSLEEVGFADVTKNDYACPRISQDGDEITFEFFTLFDGAIQETDDPIDHCWADLGLTTWQWSSGS